MHQRHRLPSTTEILQAAHLGPELNIPDSRLEFVLRRGAALHHAIELDLAGDLDGSSVVDDIAPRLTAFRAFATAVNLTPIATEIELTHPTWRVLGHPDLVAWVNAPGQERRVALIDWKSSWSPHAARIQVAAYEWLWSETYPEQPIQDCLVVELKADGNYVVHHIDLGDGRQVFQAAICIWYARKEREKA
jgi:hypothetical protein